MSDPPKLAKWQTDLKGDLDLWIQLVRTIHAIRLRFNEDIWKETLCKLDSAERVARYEMCNYKGLLYDAEHPEDKCPDVYIPKGAVEP